MPDFLEPAAEMVLEDLRAINAQLGVRTIDLEREFGEAVLEDVERCGVCGCTEFQPCMHGFETCSWAAPNLCSFCAERLASSGRRKRR
jgi:hypothetical protein